MKYAKGPDGTRGFGLGRGRPLPQGLPAPAPRLVQENLSEGLPPSAGRLHPGMGLANLAEPHSQAGKSWACVAGKERHSATSASDSLRDEGADGDDALSTTGHVGQPPRCAVTSVSSCGSSPRFSAVDGIAPPPGLNSLVMGNPQCRVGAASNEGLERPLQDAPSQSLPFPGAGPRETPPAAQQHASHRMASMLSELEPSGDSPHSPSTSLKSMLGIHGFPGSESSSDYALGHVPGMDDRGGSLAAERPAYFQAEQVVGSPPTNPSNTCQSSPPSSGLGGSRLGGWCTSTPNSLPTPADSVPPTLLEALGGRPAYPVENDPLAVLGISQLDLSHPQVSAYDSDATRLHKGKVPPCHRIPTFPSRRKGAS